MKGAGVDSHSLQFYLLNNSISFNIKLIKLVSKVRIAVTRVSLMVASLPLFFFSVAIGLTPFLVTRKVFLTVIIL